MESQKVNWESVLIKDDRTFPNNGTLPLLCYRSALDEKTGGKKTAPNSSRLNRSELASEIERLLSGNKWPASWRNGVFSYHHYHSTAHEALGVYSGSAIVQFGGPEGPQIEVGISDIVVIPAGLAHKLIISSPDFAVVGAYPEGQHPDMNYGREGERPKTDKNIEGLPLPTMDPVLGKHGPLQDNWKR